MRKPLPEDDKPIKMVVSCILDHDLYEIAQKWSKETNTDGKPLYDITVLISQSKYEVLGKETFHSYLIPWISIVNPNETDNESKVVNRRMLSLLNANYLVIEDL